MSQVEDDLALAIELQREEILEAPVLAERIRGRVPRQVDDDNRNNNSNDNHDNNRDNNVDQLLSNDVNDTRYASGRLLALTLLVSLAATIGSCIVLVLDWSKSGECFPLMRVWLVVYACLFLFHMPLVTLRYLCARRRQPSFAVHKTLIIHELVYMVFFVLGNLVLFTGENTCDVDAPLMFYWTIALIMLVYLETLLPAVILLGLCLCAPCLLLILRHLAGRDPAADQDQGATERSIEQLESRTFGDREGDIATEEDAEDDEEPQGQACSVCLSGFSVGDEVRVLPCEHEFHAACCDNWLRIRSTCPLCRRDINDGDNDANTDDDRNNNSAVEVNTHADLV
ncbi:MAG: hypothetical protein MHM6MM_004307 [Cercozoa sp. M6MM]